MDMKLSLWHPPLAASPRWQTRRLPMGIVVPEPHYYWQAVASALQHHSLPPVFDVLLESGRLRRYDCSAACISNDAGVNPPRAPIVLTISDGESQSLSTAHFAVGIGAPILLTALRQSDEDVIQIIFDTVFLNMSEASWLILHIERMTKSQCLSRESSFITHEAEEFLFRNDNSFTTCRYKRPDSGFIPPTGKLIHTGFYERVKAMPLAPAVCFYLHQDSSVEPFTTVNYFELYLCALGFMHKLELQGIHQGDSVALGKLRPHLAVIVTIALAMSGVASISAELLSDKLHAAPSAIITEDLFPGVELPIINPPQCSTSAEVTLCPKLPDINEREHFLLDETSGDFISNADFLGALLSNYDSLSEALCQGRILCANLKINKMLEIIWQTVLHGGSICVILGDISGESIVNLARNLPQTHLCIDEEILAMALERDILDSTEWVNQPTIILLREPTPSTKNLISRFGLSYVTMKKLHTNAVKDPARIILSYSSNPDLTPENILRMLETAVDLNKFCIGTCVKQIAGNKVVKYGGVVSAVEAHNMEYIRRHTKINIPAVHLVFYYDGCTYIVMDYVCGRVLQDIWNLASKNQHHMWASQLADIITQLRALPATPSTRPGPLDPRIESKCEGRWFSEYGAGPFQSYSDLATWLNGKLFFARGRVSAPPMFENTGILVATHQDLAARNLILDDNDRIWVIDWERAGWYPEYFEYACIASDIGAPQMRVPPGWTETVLSYIKPYKREYDMLKSLGWVLNVMPFA